ncbi:hypothetical protein A2482_01935 [Candidatus Falkowbacteria bacterium RIFOXYC2_FULL_48_21]|uniref:Zinc-ribbon domain-containing protein n=1 Tax=Candidatus Falkowbacteria bacterium RIFOXYC2_FULL_48_21 TaxID=1798005 RepID=A0A1F5TA22_9BACT|nr:MAG: hypothetical protein A2482_01935 [Candidatus Falkowbacteria bacterium RIFOXYC2_FULL_48_21]
MKVCSRCYTEMNDQIKACPNCGQVMQAPNRPRLPFGLKVRGEAPVGAEMFHGFAVTELKAGDEFREKIDAFESAYSIQLFRRSRLIWLWAEGEWGNCFPLCKISVDTDGWIFAFASSHGFDIERRSKLNRRTCNYASCWRLK